jgi:hypothetical protein
MAKIRKVMYRRKFNLGNYETLDIELEAEVNDNETPEAVLDELATEILAWKNARIQKAAQK